MGSNAIAMEEEEEEEDPLFISPISDSWIPKMVDNKSWGIKSCRWIVVVVVVVDSDGSIDDDDDAYDSALFSAESIWDRSKDDAGIGSRLFSSDTTCGEGGGWGEAWETLTVAELESELELELELVVLQ